MIDVIMLSKGDDHTKRIMTQKAINSILSNDKDEFNIVVVETITGVTYRGCTVIHPDKQFNYNKFTKIGYKYTSGDYVLFVNNDIIMLRNCTKYLKNALEIYPCVCPMNPRWPEHSKIRDEYSEGYSIWEPSRFTGWAFMMKRQTIEGLGIDKLFPNELAGWYSDNWITEVLRNNGLKSALVRSAKLEHLQSVTIKSLKKEEKDYYTNGQRTNFDKLLEGLE